MYITFVLYRKLYLTCAGGLLSMSYFGHLLHGTPADEQPGIDMKHESVGSGAPQNPGASTSVTTKH